MTVCIPIIDGIKNIRTSEGKERNRKQEDEQSGGKGIVSLES